MSVNILKRMQEYQKEHCWQYDIRLKNLHEDLIINNISQEEFEKISIDDFVFEIIYDKNIRKEMSDFIKRHEWIGDLSQFTTHWFATYYVKNDKKILAGVILMNQPNSFSKVLGEKTKKIERLISRGACISWSPKNLASKFMMWSIRWMVKNTQYRIFSAYSDPTAKELGTIYQACNFYYIGKKFGSEKNILIHIMEN